MLLKPGAVFKFRNKRFPEKCRPHIVVLVSDNKRVLYVAASTKVQRTQERCKSNPLTCVLAPITECPPLDANSVVDCNSFFLDEEYVLVRADSFEILQGGGASPEILEKIKTGLLKSNNTDNIARNMIMADAAMKQLTQATPSRPSLTSRERASS